MLASMIQKVSFCFVLFFINVKVLDRNLGTEVVHEYTDKYNQWINEQLLQ